MEDFPTGILFLRNSRVRAAFHDLLSSLVVSGGPKVIEEFQKCGAIQVCQMHTLMKELARAVASEAVKNRQK